MNILIVEDDALNHLLLSKLLQSINSHKIFCCNDGLEALDILSKEPEFFNLIITDIMMPNLTGIGLIRKLKDKYPILVYSALEKDFLPDDIQKYVQGYLEKPLDLNKLIKVLKTL